MRRLNVTLMIAAITVLVACISPEKRAMKDIAKLEKELYSGSSDAFNNARAQNLIAMYLDYAEKFPGDTNSPNYMFKAALVYMNLNPPQPRKAIEIYDKIILKYAGYKRVPQCVFLKAGAYENQLKDTAKAREVYEEFIKKYPKNEMADDARFAIQNMGKSTDQILKELLDKRWQEKQKKINDKEQAKK